MDRNVKLPTRAVELIGLSGHALGQGRLSSLIHSMYDPDHPIDHIQAMTRDIVERAKRYESDTVPGDFATLATPCPKCGGVVKENYKKFACQSCDWSAWKIVAGRQFEIDEIETLLGYRGPSVVIHRDDLVLETR